MRRSTAHWPSRVQYEVEQDDGEKSLPRSEWRLSHLTLVAANDAECMSTRKILLPMDFVAHWETPIPDAQRDHSGSLTNQRLRRRQHRMAQSLTILLLLVLCPLLCFPSAWYLPTYLPYHTIP